MRHTYTKRSFAIDYLVLFALMLIGFFAYIKMIGYTLEQFKIIVVTGTAYFTWGVYHHFRTKDLNWKVVVEYCAIALFGVAVLWALLFVAY